MRKIIIENLKNIKKLEFAIPDKKGVYLLVGANGMGKTSLLYCLHRICNNRAFADGFPSSEFVKSIDQYCRTRITYTIEDTGESVSFRKGEKRWTQVPKSLKLFPKFDFNQSVFIKADANRIGVTKDEIRRGKFKKASSMLIDALNTVFCTKKYNNLQQLKNTNTAFYGGGAKLSL